MLRRRRRPIAALLAFAGVLLGLASLTSTPPPSTVEVAGPGRTLEPGQVAVPVLLSSPALAESIEVGDVIDVVGVDEDGAARVVAPRARVLQTPARSSGFGGAPAAVLLLAVGEADGLLVTAAAAEGPLAFLIRDSGPTG